MLYNPLLVIVAMQAEKKNNIGKTKHLTMMIASLPEIKIKPRKKDRIVFNLDSN